ncbi:uncharacterized protein BDZ83DRAFT_601985 [Colletotrichum acutatum]|uniref:Uncharacterized protein n=1 Tax=Glomerella acutata TaxID=27357 RepID=A0AAD9D231_GLOAC|nr:uncharacterized protein BDZ83DRAFT_601985 [Colletotrichum acutatum]KAK1730226.1 hypothetical protein BDZ83DRAFT_601985 [Colletotrichum acutatum]
MLNNARISRQGTKKHAFAKKNGFFLRLFHLRPKRHRYKREHPFTRSQAKLS